MTLVEKIQQLKSMSGGLRVEMRDTYASKGVIIPVGTLPTLNEMPAITRRIPQLDFEFFFHFDDVDQFGTPRYPRRGQATGGNTYAPSLTVESLKVFDMNIEHYTSTHPSLPVDAGWIWGQNIGSSTNLTGSLELSDLKEFAFTESPFPETYAPSVDDPNAYPQS